MKTFFQSRFASAFDSAIATDTHGATLLKGYEAEGRRVGESAFITSFCPKGREDRGYTPTGTPESRWDL